LKAEIEVLRAELNELREELNGFARTELNQLRRDFNDFACTELKVLPEEDIRVVILGVIKNLREGDEIYPEDIAFEYGIDLGSVEAVMDKMLEEGIFR